MDLHEKLIRSLEYMKELYGHYPQTELQYQTPFQLLVAVVLSAQTTDKQVNKVTSELFKIVETPLDLVNITEEKLFEYVKSVSFGRAKAKNLLRTAGILVERTKQGVESGRLRMESREWGVDKGQGTSDKRKSKKEELQKVQNIQKDSEQGRLPVKESKDILVGRGYRLPDTIEEFIKLPGVGIKTAKVVIPILYGRGYVAVDTHVQRVMHRLGIVSTTVPEQTSHKLEVLIPDEWKPLAHRIIIYFGRYFCMARNPRCPECRLQDICVWYQTVRKSQESGKGKMESGK